MSEINLPLATCIGCGCDDTHACINEKSGDPCSWLVVDYDRGIGVCNVCPEKVEEFQQQYGQQEARA